MTTATALDELAGIQRLALLAESGESGNIHDACREIAGRLGHLARALAAPAALIVPPDVMRAAERMAEPLHESRLSGVTAEEDARCAWLVLSFLRAHEESK